MHDHGPVLSEDVYEPLADACSFYLVDLPCGCQDVAYACGYIDHEHDHVTCSGLAGTIVVGREAARWV